MPLNVKSYRSNVVLKGETELPDLNGSGNVLAGLNSLGEFYRTVIDPSQLLLDWNLGNVAWVSTAGSNISGQLGRIHKPFLTIAAALAAVSTGGLVIVLPGSYIETVELNVTNKNLHLLRGAVVQFNLSSNTNNSASVGLVFAVTQNAGVVTGEGSFFNYVSSSPNSGNYLNRPIFSRLLFCQCFDAISDNGRLASVVTRLVIDYISIVTGAVTPAASRGFNSCRTVEAKFIQYATSISDCVLGNWGTGLTPNGYGQIEQLTVGILYIINQLTVSNQATPLVAGVFKQFKVDHLFVENITSIPIYLTTAKDTKIGIFTATGTALVYLISDGNLKINSMVGSSISVLVLSGCMIEDSQLNDVVTVVDATVNVITYDVANLVIIKNSRIKNITNSNRAFNIELINVTVDGKIVNNPVGVSPFFTIFKGDNIIRVLNPASDPAWVKGNSAGLYNYGNVYTNSTVGDGFGGVIGTADNKTPGYFLNGSGVPTLEISGIPTRGLYYNQTLF